MFYTQILFSQMGFIWPLLKSGGLILLNLQKCEIKITGGGK